jgi:hypothetical protein
MPVPEEEPVSPKKPMLRVVAAISAACAVLALLSACSDSSPEWSASTITVRIASQESRLAKVGPDERSVYGWNRLVGDTQHDGDAVTVEMLGNVDYLRGSGPFFGFVTFTYADGSTVALRMTNGRARAATDTTNAIVSSSLRVVGGTGRYENVTGTGTFTGERKDALGGAVDSRFVLRLRS